jgi:hypothetical protein
MKPLILTLLFTCTVVLARGNEFVETLNGFQIGQYREILKAELGNPLKTGKFDDGFEYEIYLLSADTSHYMIFEFSPFDLQVIWSIQLTGINHDAAFKKLKLGMDQSQVLKLLDAPSTKRDIGQFGNK